MFQLLMVWLFLAEEDFRQDLTLRYRFSEAEERELKFLWNE